MDNIQYFRAGTNDTEMLTALRIEFLLAAGDQPREAIVALRRELSTTFSQLITDGSYICWLAATAEQVVATGGMAIRQQPGNFKNLSGRGGYIMSMYTKPAYRGRGICSELVRRLIDSGKELGVEHFELHATKAGEPIYQKLGFLLHGEPTYRKSETAHMHA